MEGLIAMKELTHEDWIKNPTPRKLWVWNDDFDDRQEAIVVFIAENLDFPVMIINNKYKVYQAFQHCAEIEKQRRMTNKELSRWLREKPTREYKYSSFISCSIYSTYTYDEDKEEEKVRKDIVIREDDGEWREPLVEVEE